MEALAFTTSKIRSGHNSRKENAIIYDETSSKPVRASTTAREREEVKPLVLVEEVDDDEGSRLLGVGCNRLLIPIQSF